MNYGGSNDDLLLLTALRKGEKKAFDALFRKYYPLLCAYAARFVGMEDAEEVVQDVMVWLWENRETHEINLSLRQYLMKAVYRGALARISRSQLKQKADTLFYEEMQEMLEDADFYRIEELGQRIREAVMALPSTYRQAFVMHRFRHMSYKEIAETFEVSPKTIDYRIQQALKQLRIDLKDYLPLLFFVFPYS
ncbi:RNA polymerase sigma-70 factor [Parabacteroides sp. OttesenSCG-928-G06]|nr:RNA polymerase sigma-70 factor [Parabacteroides sp. OttesenSCG-928-G06]